MSGDIQEYIAPGLAFRKNVAVVNLFSSECLGLELAASLGATSASSNYTANLGVYIPLITTDRLLVSQFYWHNGAAVAGNTDVGIFNDSGAVKVGSSESTLNSGTNTLQIVDVADFFLAPHTRYWLALACNSGSQQFFRSALNVNFHDLIGVKQQTSAWSGGLPTPIALNTPTVAYLPFFGIVGAPIWA